MKFTREQYDPMLLQGKALETIFNAVAGAVEQEGRKCFETAIREAYDREPTENQESYKTSIDYEAAIATMTIDKTLEYILNK